MVNLKRLSNSIPVVADYTLFDNNGLNYNAGVSSAHEVPGPAALTTGYHLQSSSTRSITARR